MKRAALVLALLCLHPAVAAAQQYGFGFEGGFTRTRVFSEKSWSAGSGFEIGGLVTCSVADRTVLQAEGRFVRKVTEATLSDGNAEIRSTMTLDYVELPILLRITLSPGHRVSPAIFGGVFGAFNTRARVQTQIGTRVVDEDVKDLMNGGDLGLVVGAGVESTHGGLTWMIDLRYSHGIVKVTKSTAGLEAKTRGLEIAAGVKWW